MKDKIPRLKKSLLTYVLFSITLFILGRTWSSIGNNQLGFGISKGLIINLLFFVGTFFFYFKITQKSIWWCLSTLFLGYFLSFLSCLFINAFFYNSSGSFANYLIFHLIFIFLNALFMFAGVYIQPKTALSKDWEDDILDDIES